MKIKEITSSLDLIIDKKEFDSLRKKTSFMIEFIKTGIKSRKIDADVFVGGSFAKKTLVKKDVHDIDIFVRFDWEYEKLTEELELIIKDASKKVKIKYEKVHGSRDYFRIKKDNILFEIIPVTRIKKPKEARNVTDLSYFHVNYVKNNTNEKIAREIVIAKAFCKACGAYGAESYIQGFSGYALECLIIYYKSFEKMLKELANVKDRLTIDPKKFFKNQNEILLSMNESKINGPIILVDPTWKERNVLAALSRETFEKFQKAARLFLKRPDIGFFEDKKIDIEDMKNRAKKAKFEFVKIKLETDKQAGDIAGTKMKKFANFISLEIEKSFEIIEKEFSYDDGKEADFYMTLKSKKEIVKIGPPVKLKDACKAFKKANKKTFEKNGYLHVKMKVNYSAKRFLQGWAKKYAKKVKEMDITRLLVK